jgi:phosphatidylinositol-3,4,5-trisphosphate 3-phosphatase/dual-specificity protein phosphatase PTEN
LFFFLVFFRFIIALKLNGFLSFILGLLSQFIGDDTMDPDPSTQPPVIESSNKDSRNLEQHSMAAATRNHSSSSNLETEGFGISAFSRFTSGFGSLLPNTEESSQGNATSTQSGVFESFTKGLVDSSRNAVKAMQVKARHVVSQNKRRYQVAHPCCCCY